MKLTCLGPSQWPLLRSGSEIIVDPLVLDELTPGDLVVYNREGTRICHRVLERVGQGYYTQWLLKGDANFKADGWICREHLLGKVVQVGAFPVKHPLFRLASRVLFFHSRLQHRLYRGIFHSPLGLKIGRLKYRYLRAPVFSWAFERMSHPWLAFPVVKSWLKPLLPLAPPSREGLRMRAHGLDYGHALFYESLFCQGDGAVENLTRLCQGNESGVLDLAGGAGRLAEALARQGTPCTLVDNSEAMLETARERKALLPPERRSLLEIVNQDAGELSLGRKFDTIVSLNNGLEHVGSEERIRQTLTQLKAHCVPTGEAFIDVHHLPFWDLHRAEWLKGKWTYLFKASVGETASRHLWERTYVGKEPNEVVWEHAVSHHGLRYELLKTGIRMFPQAQWRAWFAETGWKVAETWGTWSGAPSGDLHPKIIFRLRLQ